MAIFGIFDFMLGGGLIVGLIVATCLLRPRRRTAGEHSGPTAARVPRNRGGVVVLCALGAALVLLVLFNVAYFNGFGTDPVIGTPTRAQVTGTWVGDGGAVLVLRSDGTFTANGLPPAIGGASTTSGLSQNRVSGHGTWTIGPGDFNGPPESVIFTFICDANPSECAGQPSTFDLQAETSSPSGGGGPALFYYLGDPDDWSSQYPFVRGQ
jgi:hypothetical protein